MLMPSIHNALYTVDQVRRIDRRAIEVGAIPRFELMRRASMAAFASLRRRWPDAQRVLVVAGPGNNGGDAFLLADLARSAGMAVTVVASSHQSKDDALTARELWREGGGEILIADPQARLPDADILVDGLFGTGISRPPSAAAEALIGRMNAFAGRRLALDVPSGLDADCGMARGAVFHADATISFVGWKRGQFTADAVDCCGDLELDTLGIPYSVFAGAEGDARLLDASIVFLLPSRLRNVNKGRFGHVLAIGGDTGMGGAIRLAAEAALRSGAGLVSVATRAEHVAAINSARPELMVHAVDGPQSIEALIERCSVIALGPGLGQRAWGHAHWDRAMRSTRPLVIDADALNLLARDERSLPTGSILTPHPGEAARLLRCDIAAIQSDRFAAARELARRFAAVVVLKGAGSLVADQDGQVALCPFGNPGMASAGMGDVLTGVIAGVRAQGLDAWDAARIGVVVHAMAGDRAAAGCPRGLVASDLFAPLRDCLNSRPA